MLKLFPRVEFLIQALFRRQHACPYCCRQDIPVVTRKYGVIRIRQCSVCRLYFTDPIYRTFLVANFYDKFYRAEGTTTNLPNDMELESLKRDFFRGSDKDFTERIKVIRKMTQDGNLLEIGSSWGYFLFQARTAGIDAIGIEIGDARRQFGVERLGVPIVKDMEELNGQKFRVVYTSHVLEHFTDLSMIFGKIRDVLDPEGFLFIEVPNFAFECCGKDALKSIGAIHPLGFTTDFFRKALPMHGFRIEGFYESWDDVPSHPVEEVRLIQSLILIAVKTQGGETAT
jgi:SAM-dependent methyltransferase